jgi:hypothetical protein
MFASVIVAKNCRLYVYKILLISTLLWIMLNKLKQIYFNYLIYTSYYVVVTETFLYLGSVIRRKNKHDRGDGNG